MSKESKRWRAARLLDPEDATLVRVPSNLTPNSEADRYRWQFLRRKQEYQESFATLEEKVNFRRRTARDDDDIRDFCLQWSISEPLDPKRILDFPDDAKFERFGIVTSYLITRDLLTRLRSAAEMTSIALHYRRNEERQANILQLNIDLDAVKPSKLNLEKVVRDAQRALGIKHPSGSMRWSPGDLDRCLKAFDLRFGKQWTVTQIAAEMIRKNEPNERTKEVTRMIRRAEKLIELAPFIPF